MQRTSIEWTNFTSNPLQYRDPDGNVVHACIHKSGGCLHCYAETLARRWGRKGMPFTAENMKRLTPFLNENELHHMLTYKPASGKMCFVGDMTDLFGEWVPFELLDRLFAVFALRQDVTWQVLTKRPERMREYFERDSMGAMMAEDVLLQKIANVGTLGHTWPLKNVWLGVSVEDQKTADARIPQLLQTPAAVRFVSYEPALGAVNFTRLRPPNSTWYDCLEGREHCGPSVSSGHPKLDWIIVGGESGPKARPFNLQWARDVIAQCKAAGVACFVKQLGARPFYKFERNVSEEQRTASGGKLKISTQQLEIDTTIRLKDSAGGDPEEWFEDLRIREFPNV